MAWRDVQSAMVALGISTDKLRPADGRGATFNYVDARPGGRDPMMLFGPVSVVMPYGPKPKELEVSNVVEGEVRELPVPTEVQAPTAPRSSVAEHGPALGEPPSLWGA